MNGVYSYLGTRWYVTDLDLGFLADTGYTLRPVPEPAAMAALGLGALALVRRRRKS